MHATGATLAGVGCGALSVLVLGTSNPWFAGATALAAFVGGLLPDIDHDEAIPIREIFSILAAAIPAGVLPWLTRHQGFSTEQNICFFAGSYALIRWVAAPIFKSLTAHRGIFHSIPFAIVAGEAVALSLVGFTVLERILLGFSIAAGCFMHLALDEIYAVDFTGRRLKKSFGTAIKLWSDDLIPTMLCYGALVGLTGAAFAMFGPQLLLLAKRYF